jgi:hypothetical protein
MLILNGKFPIVNLWALLLAPLLALLLAFGAAPAWAAEGKADLKAEVKTGARAPDAVATEFYGWYLDTLGADQDPLSDRYDTFIRFVAKELSARLVERLQGGRVPQRDYFTQSASYRPAWQRSVRAATVRQRPGGADVVVTLGDSNDDGPRQVLALSMVLEGGVWKIRRVVAVDAAGSSLEQPVI